MDLMSGGMRSQGETDRETLCEVAREFHELEVEDATRTEKAIADILIKQGWLEIRDVMNILTWEESRTEEVTWTEYRAIFGVDED